MEYPYIQAWGERLGSYQYYINDQIAKARESHAPANAIYQRQDGSWATADEVTEPTTRAYLEAAVGIINGPEK